MPSMELGARRSADTPLPQQEFVEIAICLARDETLRNRLRRKIRSRRSALFGEHSLSRVATEYAEAFQRAGVQSRRQAAVALAAAENFER